MFGFLKEKWLGFYLNIAACAVGIIALIVYLVYGAALGAYEGAVIALFIVGIACGLVQVFIRFDWLILAMAVCVSLGLFAFITCTETLGSIADYVNSIVAFGHPEFMGSIVAVIVIAAIAVLIAVVGCFFRIQKKAS